MPRYERWISKDSVAQAQRLNIRDPDEAVREQLNEAPIEQPRGSPWIAAWWAIMMRLRCPWGCRLRLALWVTVGIRAGKGVKLAIGC